jgi:hypothetical protein
MKFISFSIVTLVLFVGLLGCGNPARQNARQNFKEKVAAIKVCTQDSSYSEFRRAEMDLKTSFEANKIYLDDVSNQVVNLNSVATATDYFWSLGIDYPNAAFYPKTEADWTTMEIITPDIKNKLSFSEEQMSRDPDFRPVQKGLGKIRDEADELLNVLNKQN